MKKHLSSPRLTLISAALFLAFSPAYAQDAAADAVKASDVIEQRTGAQSPTTGKPTTQFTRATLGDGQVWVTEDPAVITPELSVSAPAQIAISADGVSEPVTFSVYSNYATYIKKAEIHVRETAAPDSMVIASIPVAIVPNAAHAQVVWDGRISANKKLDKDSIISYSLKVYDDKGVWDETRAKHIKLVDAADKLRNKEALADRVGLNEQAVAKSFGVDLENRVVALEQWGSSDLATQNIRVEGSRVRVRGEGVPKDYALNINGSNVPVDKDGKFVAEYIVPTGTHQFNVVASQSGNRTSYEAPLSIDVTGRYFAMVALADLTVSKTGHSGSIDSVNSTDLERFDDVQTDGRLAFYLKGKIKGRYLITAQADTKEREIKDLFDGFLKADPKDLFRRIDPDRYYPIYGDDSTTTRDVNTQGRLYVRLDWDKNQVLWGNYNTEFSDTNLIQYNRGLYGAQAKYRSEAINDLGESKTQVKAFAAEQETASGHSEFLGTGGSLYYLRHTDVLSGSERVVMVKRDELSGRVLNEVALQAGRDYEIDAFQGRIILNRPLTEYVGSSNVANVNGLRDGERQHLVVDYEYIPDGFDKNNLSAGVRGKQWIGDHVAIGAQYVSEKRGGKDYELKGVDLTLQAGRGTYLTVEHAQSESAAAPIFYSDNGGLSFLENTGSGQTEGKATEIRARVNLQEQGFTQRPWTLGAWHQRKDAGFSSTYANATVGRLTDSGFEFTGEVSNKLSLKGSYNKVKLDDEERERARLAASYEYASNQKVTVEGSRVNDVIDDERSRANLAAIRFDNRINKNIDVYAAAQTAFSRKNYDKNTAYTVGGKYTFSNLSNVGLEYTNGDRGNAITGSAEYRRSENHTLYTSYTHSTDSTLKDNLFSSARGFNRNSGLTVGQRWQLNPKVTLNTESSWLEDKTSQGVVHGFGLQLMPKSGWNVGLSAQKGRLTSVSTDAETKRQSYSANVGYNSNQLDWVSKLEYRQDKGSEDTRQWVSTNRLTYIINNDWRVLTRLNYANTRYSSIRSNHAKLIETGLGLAYRPTRGKWNGLLKYTYLYDLSAVGQTTGDQPDQRSHIFSMEGTYEASPRWEFSGKLAHRISQSRISRGEGAWYKTNATLAALQARYHFNDRGDIGNIWRGWHAMAEYRWLNVQGSGAQSGALVAVEKDVNKYTRVGVGYNFTRFSADLSKLNHDQKGWFVTMTARY